jgi:DNA primase
VLIVESIDVEEYLQSRNITYSPPGSKNVGRSHIGISCPFCGDHADTGDNHLGINLETKQWNCWICGAGSKKHFLSLVVKLENCSYKQAEALLKPFAHSDLSLIRTSTDKPLVNSQGYFKMPKESTRELLKAHRKYLESRNFDAEYIFNKYQLECVGPISRRWKLSLLAPVFYHHRRVSFVSADITRKREQKYKNCPITESLVEINNTLYNFDNAGSRVIVTEGVTDVWNIGDGAVALYTKRASASQLKLLSLFDKVFIMLDSDSVGQLAVDSLSPADRLSYDLAAFTDSEIIELDYGDPADMDEDDVRVLRREIFGH